MSPRLIEIEEARRIVLEHTKTLESEPVELGDTLGRVLARDVESTDPVPPFDSSAMDGFAVRCADARDADTRTRVRLRVIDESRAGHPAARRVGRGESIAISTGAMMPKGADAVAAVEQTRTRDGFVEILSAVAAGEYVRLAGDDISPRQTVLAAGTPLGPAHLGVLASLGRAEVTCVRRPRVSVILTGDELVEPGRELTPGAIYNSNAYSVPALALHGGANLASTVTVPDDSRTIRETIAEALDSADVVVLCGGVSVGAHDHVRASLAELHVREHFWGVALKPGKPTWFGTRGDALVFGLPGNPVSALVTFALFVRPALGALAGASIERRSAAATITRDYSKRPGRAHAIRCRLQLSDAGWRAEPTGDQRSHILTSMLDADALAIIPSERGSVRAGERVEIELLDRACPSIV